jgi:hypothetical protein
MSKIRDICKVIDLILAHVPPEEVTLCWELSLLQDDAFLLPPEGRIRLWSSLADLLQTHIRNPPTSGWTKTVADIVNDKADFAGGSESVAAQEDVATSPPSVHIQQSPLKTFRCRRGHEFQLLANQPLSFAYRTNSQPLMSTGPLCHLCLEEDLKKNYGLFEKGEGDL